MAIKKFRKGQKVVCIHYKNKPIVTVTDTTHFDYFYKNYNEVWVKETFKNGKTIRWWGPASWFKPLKKGGK